MCPAGRRVGKDQPSKRDRSDRGGLSRLGEWNIMGKGLRVKANWGLKGKWIFDDVSFPLLYKIVSPFNVISLPY
jgi:hypothetical protein